MILELYFDKGDFKILLRIIYGILPYNYHEIFFSIIIIIFFQKIDDSMRKEPKNTQVYSKFEYSHLVICYRYFQYYNHEV